MYKRHPIGFQMTVRGPCQDKFEKNQPAVCKIPDYRPFLYHFCTKIDKIVIFSTLIVIYLTLKGSRKTESVKPIK